MKTINPQKVLETVYVHEWDTTALILETEVRAYLFIIGKSFNKQECLEYIKTNMPGWVQATNYYKESVEKGIEYGNGAHDFITPYENLFGELEAYAKQKYWPKEPTHAWALKTDRIGLTTCGISFSIPNRGLGLIKMTTTNKDITCPICNGHSEQAPKIPDGPYYQRTDGKKGKKIIHIQDLSKADGYQYTVCEKKIGFTDGKFYIDNTGSRIKLTKFPELASCEYCKRLYNECKHNPTW